MDNRTINAFLNELASSAPTPGGGGAAALTGAVGAALGAMVGSLTVGKKRYAAVEEEVQALLKEAKKLAAEMEDMILKDAEDFQPLAEAYRLPADTDEEKKRKEMIMQGALVRACETPLGIMACAVKALTINERMAAVGSKLAVSDAGAGSAVLKGALNAASLNIYINAASLKDEAAAKNLLDRAERLRKEGNDLAEAVFENVRLSLSSGNAGDGVHETDENSGISLQTVKAVKRLARKEALLKRRSLTAEERDGKSRKICKSLASLPEIKRAGTILTYAATDDEVCLDGLTEELARQGKTVAFPVTDKTSRTMAAYSPHSDEAWTTDAYGIRCPVPGQSDCLAPDVFDVVLIPCVAFDSRGTRLGHGAGYYDRYLPDCRPDAIFILTAFEEQEITYLEAEECDVPVDLIATDRRVIYFH